MRIFRTAVVAVILSAMFSPALALAKAEPPVRPVPAERLAAAATMGVLASEAARAINQQSESSRYAQREQQSQDAQNFKGGAVYVYFGSGLVLALVIIILILVI